MIAVGKWDCSWLMVLDKTTTRIYLVCARDWLLHKNSLSALMSRQQQHHHHVVEQAALRSSLHPWEYANSEDIRTVLSQRWDHELSHDRISSPHGFLGTDPLTLFSCQICVSGRNESES